MLVALAVLLYMAALTFVYGSVATLLLQRYLPSSAEERIPLPVVHITGLVILAVIAGYFSIFLKIGAVANLIVTLGAILLYLLHRSELNDLARGHITGLKNGSSLLVGPLFVLLSVLALIEATEQPKDGDTGLYHLQTIKWIEDYRVVPGLGNLHPAFAPNSMWYPVSALFGFSFLGIPTLHVVNAAFLLFALGFFLGGVRDVITRSISFTNIVKAAAIPFTLVVYKVQIGSASTDMPAALLLLVATILAIENNEGFRVAGSRAANVVVLALLLYAVTVKLSVLPILLFVLYLLYLEYRVGRTRDILVQAGLAAIIVVPWGARNVFLSGYLIYPFQYLDLFSMDWKMPHEDVSSARRLIQGWARRPGPNWQDSLGIPPWEWVPRWLGSMYYRYAVAIVITFVIMLAAVPGAVLRGVRTRGFAVRDVLYLTACIGMIFWFATAPEPKYAWGFIFIALVIPLVPVAEWLAFRFTSASQAIVLAVVAFYIVNYTYLSIRSLPRTTEVLTSPQAYPRDELVTERVDGVIVYGPKKTFCWDAPLPCTDVLDDRMRPRGGDLQSGFRIVQTP